MAWGLFNKIKKGLKKAFNFAKEKIVKPFLGVATKAAPLIGMAANAIAPGSGIAVTGAINGANAIMNDIDEGDWSKAFDGAKTLSRRIQLK